MKRWKRLSAWVFVTGITLSLTMITGCGDDPVDVGDTCKPWVLTNRIISNPLVPVPGDTTLLTIQAEGDGCNNWAAYRWTVEGGELLQEQGITVQWVAPMEYGAYLIRCTASLSGAKPDTSRALIMIREFTYIDTEMIASVKPTMVFNSLYFIAEEGVVGPRSNDFLGWAVFKILSTGRVILVTDTGDLTGGGSYEFDFARSEEAIYGSFLSGYYAGLRQQRRNVWKFPTIFGSAIPASDDPGGMGVLRKNQHRYPMTNAVGDKAVWKYQFAGAKPDGSIDLFNVAYWDESDGAGNWYTLTTSHDSTATSVGMSHRYFYNIRPMFTPSEDNILYFVDTTGVFEPCLIPMTGGAPDTLQRRALMVSEKTGIFKQAGISIGEKTVFEWNPGVAFLSFISAGRIVFFYYASETVAIVNDLSKVKEFAWSPDGSQLAAVNDEAVYLVGAGGAVQPNPVFVKERATDDIKGINWNDDDTQPQLAFRLTRKGKSAIDSWSALVIVDLNSGLWAYASPTVPWHSSRDPNLADYTWMRVIFDGTDVYAPFPVLDDVNYPGKDVILIHSHE